MRQHGDTHGGVGILFKKRLGEPLGFPSEHQKNALGILHLGIGARGFGAEIGDSLALVFFKKLFLVFVVGNVE